MILIGISGKKRSGKDATASLIQQKLSELSYERIAFADALKREVATACRVSVPYLEEHKDNFRLILQGWGTDFRRQLNGDSYWIDQWAKSFLQTEASLVIAPDIRFENEADHILEIGGILIRVSRPSVEREADMHPSECALDNCRKFNYFIRNDESLQSLSLCVDEIVNQIKRKHNITI